MSADNGKPVAIDGVTKRYADVVALNNVRIDVAGGEFCTLLGASGSGKTTLLKVIAGFETHDQGSVRIDGRDVGVMPVAARNIGMVFQNYALFPHMTVFRNVSFGLEMRKLPNKEVTRRVEAVLGLVSLNGLAERLPAELSGGQQQRVALARALVIEPDILLMDEPLGALDRNLRQSIQLQLRRIHQEVGATVIYVTHDQEEALHLSDRICILDAGHVVQTGSPRELYFKPINKFVAGFLGECNFLTLENGEEIGLRPEALVGVTDGVSADCRITLDVESVVFLGTGVKVIGRYLDQEVTALLSNEEFSAMPEAGTRIELAYQARSIIRFQEAS